MVKFPNAKINLGLNVIEKRGDGYHNIESVFYPVKIYDVLEIVKSDTLEFYYSGKKIKGNKENNLCHKAYTLIKEKYEISPVSVYLKKIIPMGAGMGGGSSDGAYTLLLLNELFELEITNAELKQYALQLGSDCPFFIENKPAYVHGRGELCETINLNLENYSFIFITTGIHISTAQAYQGITCKKPQINVKEIITREGIEHWKLYLKNDFETVAFKNYPCLMEVKNALYHTGAFYASMTGSGSAFYGIYPEMNEFERNKLQTQLELMMPKTHTRYEIIKEVYLH